MSDGKDEKRFLSQNIDRQTQTILYIYIYKTCPVQSIVIDTCNVWRSVKKKNNDTHLLYK